MKKLKKVLFLAIITAISLAIFFIVSELFLRTAGYLGDSERQNTVYHSDYGQVRKNNWALKIEIDPLEDKVISIYDQIIPIKKGKNESRVVFIGDSATFGAGVPMHQSFPLLFQRKATSLYPEANLRAVNAGVVGLSPIDEYMLLSNQLTKLSPDVVVMGLFVANDINFNLAQYLRKKSFHEAPVSQNAFYFLRYRSALFHFSLHKFISINNKFFIINRLNLNRLPQIPTELRLIDENNLNLASYIEGEAALYLTNESYLVSMAYKYLEETLQQFSALSKENYFEFVVLLIPTASSTEQMFTMPKFAFATDIIQEKIGNNIEAIDFDFDRPFKKILEICSRQSITCIDTSADYQSAGMGAFLPGDDHPSITGHLILADKLLEHDFAFKSNL